MFGLSNGNSNANYTDIDFAIYLDVSAQYWIYEGGTLRGSFAGYAAGDVFRVAVQGGQVKYLRNGVVFYTSTLSPAYPLLVDTAFYTTGLTLHSAVISGTLIGSPAGP